MTKAAAAARYLALAAGANATFDATLKKYLDAQGYFKSLTAFQAWQKSAAILTRRFADNIRKTAWPTDAAADIKLMLRQLAAEEAAYLRASQATTWAEANTLNVLADKAATTRSDTSNLVRADLGLPSVPVG